MHRRTGRSASVGGSAWSPSERENDWDDEPTAEYDLTPEVPDLPRPGGERPTQTFIDAVVVHHQNPKSWLQAHGIEFPPGASAIYQPKTHRLIIRNTSDTVEHIEMLIDP